MNTTTRRLTLPVVTACAVALWAPAPATAGVVDAGSFHDEFSYDDPDFCGSGLAVHGETTVDGTFRVVDRGGEWFYQEHIDLVDRVTNPATGRWTEFRESHIAKDLKITDNGDGTISVLVLATGPGALWDDTGRLIARADGQVRWVDTVDLNDPEDPEDDEFLGREFVKESTGTNDDICAASLAALQ